MKQKAFSIMEMVLVMVIVGILVVGIGSFLTYDEQTRRYKAETCLNQLNGELQGFMKAAMTSKALKS
ncbi:MAG: type II secretion system GspH family protein [Candidatus Peribacteria bacterium]|nr:type II secretion system GspH family protein [Candidatus Peribacteria bacterium]